MPSAQASRASSSLPAWPPRSSGRRHAPPWTALTLSRAPPLLWLSPSHHPNTPAAADVHHRGHRLPLASLTGSRAPPSRPRPYRQATRRRTPWSTVVDAIFVLRTDGRRRPIRRHQAVPEAAEITYDPAVSS